MQAPDHNRVHDPEAATLIPGVKPLHTSTPLSSSIDQRPALQPTPTVTPRQSRIPKIATAVIFSVAAALGVHKCASNHNNPEVAKYSVASSLGDVERLAETLIEADPKLPDPKNDAEALRNFIKRNDKQLSTEKFDEAFALTQKNTRGKNKYIQVMLLEEKKNDDGYTIDQEWSPVTKGIVTCGDPTWCIFAIRAKKDRYRGLISFRKQHKPDVIWRDDTDPNIIYVGFEKPGYSSINVQSPGQPNKNLFLTRIAIQPKSDTPENNETEE